MPPNSILAILQIDKYHYIYFTIIKEAIHYSMLLPSMFITKSKKHQFLSISSFASENFVSKISFARMV